MERYESFFMDYRKINELFMASTRFQGGEGKFYQPGKRNDKFLLKNELDMTEKIIHRQQIEEDWFEVPFAITAAGHYEVGDRHYTKRAGCEYFELIYTVSGHGIAECADMTFDCTANTALLIDCSQPHSFHVKSGKTWEYKHIHFIPDGAARNVAMRAVLNLVSDNGVIKSLFSDTVAEFSHIRNDSHFILSHNISAILTEIIRYQFKNAFTDPQKELIKRAIKFIHEHYHEKISVKQIADQEFISEYYLIRLFKKYYGVPPYNYLMEYRLMRAKNMILQQGSIRDVAQECGFSSANSFSRSFRCRFGVTPGQYCKSIAMPQESSSGQAPEKSNLRENHEHS